MEVKGPIKARTSTSLRAALRRCSRTGTRGTFIVWLIAFAVVMPVATTPMFAEAQTASEYSVKAAFLYNFAKYVEWLVNPPGDGRLIVGVLGEDPFGDVIDRIVAGKSVNGRRLEVRRLRWGQDLRQCQILFISSSERSRLPQIMGVLKGASVLTVGETDQFGEQGGMIRFILENSRVRFEINVDAAERAGLKISSKLLAVARVVRGRH